MSDDRIISLAHLTVYELTPPEVIATADAAGYRHASIRLHPASPGEPQHPMIGDTPMMRETLRRMADTGVRLLDFEILRLTAETRVEIYRPVLEAGARLGGQFVLVAGDDPDPAAMTERFAEICELGRPLGITMALEFMPWTGVRTLAAARHIVEAAGQENGRVLVDAIHVDRSGGTAAEVAALPRRLHSYFQICDLPAERPGDDATMIYQARQARLPPGEGGIDVLGMVRAVPRDVPVSVEIPMAERAKTVPAVDRARELLAATRAMLARADEP